MKLKIMRKTGWWLRFALLILLAASFASCRTSPEKKKTDLYQKGLASLQKGEVQAAILLLKNALEVDKTFADAHYQLGMAYFRIQDYNKAVIEFGNAAAYDPKNIDARLQVANYYAFYQKDGAKALSELEKLRQEYPNEARVFTALGDVSLLQAQPAEAIAAYQKSLALDPTLAQPGVALARIFLGRGEAAQAQAVIAALDQHLPKTAEAYLVMAAFYMETNQLEVAKQFYEKVIALDAQNTAGYLGVAEIYLAQQQPDQAIAQTKTLKDLQKEQLPREAAVGIQLILGRAYLMKQQYREAAAELPNVTQAFPGLLIGHYSLGLAQAGLGNFEQAIEAYTNALKIAESAPQQNARYRPPIFYSLALAYFKKDDPENALKYAQAVLQENPNHAEAHDLLGLIYNRTKHYAEALEQFALAAQSAPELPQLRQHKAMVLVNMGKADDAMQEIQQALDAGQKSVDLYLQLAKAQAAKGLIEQAIRNYQHASALAPNYPTPYIELSNLYVVTGQFKLALDTLAKVLPQQANQIDVQYVLGRAYAGEKRFEEAKELLSKVTAAKPDFADAHYALAMVYAALKDVAGAAPEARQDDEKSAEKEYETVLRLAPEHLPSLLHLATIKLNLGSDDEALKYAQQILTLAPDNNTALGILITVYARNKQYDQALETISLLQAQHPDAPGIYIGLGIFHLNKAEFDAAIAQAQQAITLDPANPVPYDTIGRAYLGKRDLEQAEGYFRKALEIDPQFARAYVKLGQIQTARKNAFQAIRDFRQALAIQPNDEEALVELGRIYQSQQRSNEAIALFEKLFASVDEKNAAAMSKGLSAYQKTALEALVNLYTQQEDFAKVIGRAVKLIKVDEKNTRIRYLLAQAYAKRGDYNNAALHFRELTIAEPDFVGAQLDLGHVYILTTSFENALAQFAKMQERLAAIPAEKLAQAPENKSQIAAARVEAHVGAAVVYQLQQNYPAAIAEMQAALAQDPESQRLHFLLGNIYVSQKSFADAAEQFRVMKFPFWEAHVKEQELRSYYGDQSAVSAAHYNLGLLCSSRRWLTAAQNEYTTSLWRNSQNPLLHYALGNLYFSRGDYENALKSCEETLKLEPTFTYAYKVQGDVYQAQKRTDKAITAYKLCLASNPDDIAVRVLLALMYAQKKDVSNATAEYQKCLASNPDNVVVLNQLAWMYADRGEQLDDALQYAQKAAALQPVPGVLDTLGWVFYQRGEYAQAIAQFQRALENAPFQATIKYHLGLAYQQNGDRASAQQTLTEVLELVKDAKDFEYAAEVRQLVEKLAPTP